MKKRRTGCDPKSHPKKQKEKERQEHATQQTQAKRRLSKEKKKQDDAEEIRVKWKGTRNQTRQLGYWPTSCTNLLSHARGLALSCTPTSSPGQDIYIDKTQDRGICAKYDKDLMITLLRWSLSLTLSLSHSLTYLSSLPLFILVLPRTLKLARMLLSRRSPRCSRRPSWPSVPCAKSSF